MQQQKPKRLWVARVNFRQPGKWMATEEFLLGKPYKPEIPMRYKCHVLFETPMEAFLSIHKEIMEQIKKSNGWSIDVFLYSTKVQLITSANYFSPEKLDGFELFSHDKDFFRRHLVRQSLVFERAANIKINNSRFNKEPVKQISYTNTLGKEVNLLTCRLPSVEMTFGIWSKYMCKSVEEGAFNFGDFPFKQPISVTSMEKALCS